jgi:RNA polymerase sigma-70 factor (ECF subfamily)
VDRTLVGRAQRGDREAYEAIVRAVAPRLYRTAYRIVRDADAAEDAAQQALVTIWRELPSLRDLDRFDAWTYRLLVRACLADSRRRRRAGVLQITIDDAIPVAGDPIAGVDLRDQLTRALDALSTEHRVVVVLHHYVGLPLGEIAGILGIPYGTVGSRLHHATRALRASLADPAPAPLTGGQPA